MLCIYRVKDGKDDEFQSLLEKHWPTLRSAGLASEKEARWFRGEGKNGERCFIELFEWKDEKASSVAHETPEVMSVWEPMGALTDGMEFIEIEAEIASIP
jgi:hypothetical protein